ncbi:MAG: Na-Ca exchanger/integrin-beta4 [Puniceicoccaceae bacterium 5H]|nr:MAG: Na-Ca exchanger/integrin-beta4 [Puniceicoccaceae bacterium 5H]
MTFRSLPRLLLALVPVAPLVAQINNPIPEAIGYGDLTLQLQDWASLPRSSGGGGGTARLSVMRHLTDGRLFVNDQRGLIYEVEQGKASLYLNVRGQLAQFIDQPGLGTGLHSFAFHPDFLENGKLYTVHSEPWNSGAADLKGPTAPVTSAGQMSVISEWTTSNPQAGSFTGTRRELLRIYYPSNVHCAQEIAFNPNANPGDPDYGMLYICSGEGGSYLNGYWQNEQRLDSPMGTVLRIDPTGNDSANGQYGIPDDNPWADATDPDVLKEIYAYGFRNPHRITWDTSGQNRAYIGDIGERQIEEVDLLEPGRNYGFPQREGTFVLDPTQPDENTYVYPLPADDATYGYTYPVAQYDHDEGRSIALGPVYRGDTAPTLDGTLFFGDIVEGRVFYLDESTLTFGAQATIREARLRLNGVEGSLTSFVGNNRADLRWGMDGAGDVYIMTKTDGKIRKIVGATSTEGAFDNDPERWQRAMDLSEAAPVYSVDYVGTGGSVETVSDPFGEGDNAVLAVTGRSSLASLPITTTPTTDKGSIYFRFALSDTTAEGIFSAGTQPLISQASIIGQIQGGGTLAVNDSGTMQTATRNLRPGVWYEAWLVFPNDGGRFSLYVRGDNWTAPTLLRSGLNPARSVGGGLTSLVFGADDSSGAEATVYLDDVYVDPAAANISAPVAGHWALVSNFEQANAFDIWSFTDMTTTASTPPVSTATLQTETNGNHALRIAATPAEGVYTHALAQLPRRIEVGETVTFYSRMRVEDFATNQVWGLVNVPATNILSERFEAFDAMGRWTDDLGANRLQIRDDTSYQLAGGTYGTGQWQEVWMVVRNGGEASGGQTFDVYARPSGSTAAPTRVYTDAGFRIARETPMAFFQIIASKATDGKGAAVAYDDLFLAAGEVLDAPSGIGYGLYPGAGGEKSIPWLGMVWDTAYPWIYQPNHGWWFVNANDPAGAWHFDRQLGWIWVMPEPYPYLYVSERGEWLYYLEGTREPRKFYAFSEQRWIVRERS